MCVKIYFEGWFFIVVIFYYFICGGITLEFGLKCESSFLTCFADVKKKIHVLFNANLNIILHYISLYLINNNKIKN